VVKDGAGEPLIGATVVISGAEVTNGTVTNIDGEFNIEVPSAESELVISYIGFTKHTIKVGEQTFLEIVLKEDALGLDEVVILGYGTVTKSNVIGTISSVKAEEIENRPVADLAQAMKGKATGVSIINNSGAPGEGTILRIRGVGTVNNAEPLYVVDGFVTNGMGHVSISDVESIEILKDAASAAIYGAEGANGVVIINTKKGKAGKLSLNADYQHTFQTYNYNRIEVMDRFDWYINNEIAHERFGNARGAIDIGRDAYHQSYPNVNWIDEISRMGSIDKATVSLTQGTEKLKYYLSYTYRNNQGVIINSGFMQNNVNLNLDVTPNPKIKVNLKAAYAGSQKEAQGSGTGSIIKNALIDPPTDIYDRVDGFMTNNPIKKANLVHNLSNSDRTDLNAKVLIDISAGLKFESRIGYYYNAYYGENYGFVLPRYAYEFYEIGDYQKPSITNQLNKGKGFNFENMLHFNKTVKDHTIGAILIQSLKSQESINVRSQGSTFLFNNTNFAYPSLATFELSNSGLPGQSRSLGFAGIFDYNYNQRYLLKFNFRYDGSSLFPQDSRWGFFPSLQLGWRISEEEFMKNVDWINQFKLRATVGQSGNNRINRDKQYTIYNNENYISYGTSEQFVIFDGYIANNIGNPDILWEKTATSNLGVDLGLFRALNLTFDVFKRNTTDMLIAVPIVSASGLTSAPLRNAGSVENSGFEIDLRYNKTFGDIDFGASFNYTWIRNKVTDLANGSAPIRGGNVNTGGIGQVTYTTEGNSIGQFYGHVYDENDMFYRTVEEVKANEVLLSGKTGLTDGEAATYIGSFKYKDLNGDSKLDDEDKTFLGSPYPKYSGGFGANVGFKGFKLDVFCTYQVGNKIFNLMKYYLDAGAIRTGNNASDITNKRQENIGNYIYTYNGSKDGDIPVYNPVDNQYWATLPSLSNVGNVTRQFNGNKPSNFFIEDGSYLRLKDVSLSYSFKQETIRRLKLKNITLIATATNLLTFTKYSGFDPEIGSIQGEGSANLSTGIDYGTYPQPVSFTIGIKAGF